MQPTTSDHTETSDQAPVNLMIPKLGEYIKGQQDMAEHMRYSLKDLAELYDKVVPSLSSAARNIDSSKVPNIFVRLPADLELRCYMRVRCGVHRKARPDKIS